MTEKVIDYGKLQHTPQYRTVPGAGPIKPKPPEPAKKKA